MKTMLLSLAASGLALSVAHASDVGTTVMSDLKGNSGEAIGKATLIEAPKGVILRLQVSGLTPGWHGLHLHEKADCSKSDFTSAGGHVHTHASMVHGLLNPDANEAGDLPNLYVGPNGQGVVELFSTYVSLDGADGRATLQDADGSAIVIHASPDDHVSQPIGGAGARVACGVIGG